jgi:hypothetical protein
MAHDTLLPPTFGAKVGREASSTTFRVVTTGLEEFSQKPHLPSSSLLRIRDRPSIMSGISTAPPRPSQPPVAMKDQHGLACRSRLATSAPPQNPTTLCVAPHRANIRQVLIRL